MKIIYDNIIFSLQRAGGISVYWSELLKRISAEEGFQCTEMPGDNIFRKQLNVSCERESGLPVKLLRYLPYRRKADTGSVFHSSYYRTLRNRSVKNIVTVYDFTYEHFRSGPAKLIHSQQKRSAIQKADGIICISENTRNDMLRFFPESARKKQTVIYISAGSEFRPLNTEKTGNQVVFVGDRAGYKNFETAVHTMLKHPDLKLLAIGGKPLSVSEIGIIKDLGNRFEHRTGISSEELNKFYNRAFCLLYPSSYEGFGIPVLEAMKAGCPVVALNASSIPEVAGDAALLADKADADAFSEKIEQLRNPEIRETMIRKGLKQAEKFSWDRCYQETMDFYRTFSE